MISEVISEREMREKLALWMLENRKGTVLPQGMTKEDFAADYPMPDIEFEHTQSYADGEGNLVTLCKGEVRIKDWERKASSSPCAFTVYKVLKTPLSNPDTEPFPAGYIVVDY